MITVAYTILSVVGLIWLALILIGTIGSFPFGLLPLAVFVALSLILAKVLKDRFENEEDDYYSNNIDK